MENATKALLIAAAVLIAILIISLGLIVYNRSASTVQQADLSSQEIQAQNEKFTRYNGKNKRGSEVNSLLQTVLNYNLNTTDDGNKVEVTSSDKSAPTLSKSAKSITEQADTSVLYDITVNYGGAGGLVNTIDIKKAGSKTTTPTPTPGT